MDYQCLYEAVGRENDKLREWLAAVTRERDELLFLLTPEHERERHELSGVVAERDELKTINAVYVADRDVLTEQLEAMHNAALKSKAGV